MIFQKKNLFLQLMKKDNLIRGMIGILALFAGIGSTMYLTPNQLENSYICTTNREIGIFDKLSITNKTAYWTENSIEKSKICKNGSWISLKQYARDNNISLNTLLNNQPIQANGLKYLCDPVKCEEI